MCYILTGVKAKSVDKGKPFVRMGHKAIGPKSLLGNGQPVADEPHLHLGKGEESQAN